MDPRSAHVPARHGPRGRSTSLAGASGCSRPRPPSRRSDGTWRSSRADKEDQEQPDLDPGQHDGPPSELGSPPLAPTLDQRTAHPLAATTIATATEAARARDGKLETCCGMASSTHVVQA